VTAGVGAVLVTVVVTVVVAVVVTVLVTAEIVVMQIYETSFMGELRFSRR
jgi:hypothetical protein